MEDAYPPLILVENSCNTFLNGVYELRNITWKTGRPLYVQIAGLGYRALVFDADCDAEGPVEIPFWYYNCACFKNT